MNTKRKQTQRVYLDYAASTPVRKEVLHALMPYRGVVGNPSAIHQEGQTLSFALGGARREVAQLLGVRSEEVFFTSGGTESNNLAIIGLIESLLEKGRRYEECEIITTTIEHPSISGVLKRLKKKGVRVHEMIVDAEGRIDISMLSSLLSPQTVLVTCAYANSEIGVVQDIKKITRIVREYRREKKGVFPYVHLDASQAPLYLPLGFAQLGVDIMTLDAQKMYGPPGAGALIKKHDVPLLSLMSGGDQEGGLRPGTENVSGAVGCAVALRYAVTRREARVKKVTNIREYGIDQLLKEIPGALLNGSRENRIANNIHISIPGIDGEYAAVVLDTHGIAVSTKSACSGKTGSGSHVIYAMGGDDARALSTLRITLGEETTKKDIDVCIEQLKSHVSHMKKWRS